MRSTLFAIAAWSLATILMCVAGIWATARLTVGPQDPSKDPVRGMLRMIAEDAAAAFEVGGASGLATYLRHISESVPGERALLDPRGRDLATGEDRSRLLEGVPDTELELSYRPGGRGLAAVRAGGGRYRFVWLAEPGFEPPRPWPFIAAVASIITSMGAILALYLSLPLRRLRDVMARFGRGDLHARVGSRRGDEIGVVSREFDLLADRVETLLAAERRLLRDVSHELRSPLTRIDVAVDLALKRDDPRPLLDRIRRDVTRLSDLVASLLQLTRLEGEPSARPGTPVDPSRLLLSLIEVCTIEAESRGCRLEARVVQTGPIPADGELLRRAFENVLCNAIRHAPEGTPILVAYSVSHASHRLTVRDHGPGVPEDSLEAIFEPFVRVEGDRSRATGGAGLGLAIARRAVAIHRGSISAYNAAPGLCVVIDLPAS